MVAPACFCDGGVPGCLGFVCFCPGHSDQDCGGDEERPQDVGIADDVVV